MEFGALLRIYSGILIRNLSRKKFFKISYNYLENCEIFENVFSSKRKVKLKCSRNSCSPRFDFHKINVYSYLYERSRISFARSCELKLYQIFHQQSKPLNHHYLIAITYHLIRSNRSVSVSTEY